MTNQSTVLLVCECGFIGMGNVYPHRLDCKTFCPACGRPYPNIDPEAPPDHVIEDVSVGSE